MTAYEKLMLKHAAAQTTLLLLIANTTAGDQAEFYKEIERSEDSVLEIMKDTVEFLKEAP